MINLFFFDEYNSSLQNGIGTYRDILLPQLSLFDIVSVNLISLNHYTNIPCVKALPYKGSQICVPFQGEGGWRENGNNVSIILSNFIEDSYNNIFMLNHSPASKFIQALKKKFPKTKIIFTVHDQGWGSALLGDSKLLHEIWIKRRKPTIVSERTYNNVISYCQSEIDIYNLVDRVMSISPFMHSVMLNIYSVDKQKAVTVSNGIEPLKGRRLSKNSARKKLGLINDEELMIFAGRPVRHKGIIPLLIAMRTLMLQRPKLRCIMCGSLTGFADFIKFITPVASRLIFTGQIPRSDLHTWYAAADIGIMPSYSEPFGYSALEMINEGLPVVVSDRMALSDIYKDKVNAFVAPIGSNVLDFKIFAKNIAKAINRALDAKISIRQKMRKTNRKLIATQLSSVAMANGYLKIFQDMTSHLVSI